MKFSVIFITFMLTSTVTPQSTEFVEYLLQLQFASQGNYDSMQLTVFDARTEIHEHIRFLSSAAMLEVTEALNTIEGIQLVAQEFIENATGSDECLQVAIDGWNNQLSNADSSFGLCVENSVTPIIVEISSFDMLTIREFEKSFEIQNIILNALSEVNPVTNQGNITNFAGNQLDELSTRFNYEVIPELSSHIQAFNDLRSTIPFEIHDCLGNEVMRIEDESLVLRNTLELC